MHVSSLLKLQQAPPGSCDQCDQFKSPVPTGERARNRSGPGQDHLRAVCLSP